MPVPNRLMTRPRTVLPLVWIVRPLPPTLAPFSSMIGAHAAPGAHGAPMNARCVVPSITTGTVMLASGNCTVGAIVNGPDPGILKAMVLGEPAGPAFAFDSSIACRSDPVPLVCVLVTVNVSGAAGAVVVTPALLFALLG